MKRHAFLYALAVLMAACTTKDNQTGQRREALRQKQEKALSTTRLQAAATDSLLQATAAEYDTALRRMEAGDRSAAMEQRLTTLRLRRDSLQVQLDTQCATVKYILGQQKKN